MIGNNMVDVYDIKVIIGDLDSDIADMEENEGISQVRIQEKREYKKHLEECIKEIRNVNASLILESYFKNEYTENHMNDLYGDVIEALPDIISYNIDYSAISKSLVNDYHSINIKDEWGTEYTYYYE